MAATHLRPQRVAGGDPFYLQEIWWESLENTVADLNHGALLPEDAVHLVPPVAMLLYAAIACIVGTCARSNALRWTFQVLAVGIHAWLVVKLVTYPQLTQVSAVLPMAVAFSLSLYGTLLIPRAGPNQQWPIGKMVGLALLVGSAGTTPWISESLRHRQLQQDFSRIDAAIHAFGQRSLRPPANDTELWEAGGIPGLLYDGSFAMDPWGRPYVYSFQRAQGRGLVTSYGDNQPIIHLVPQ